MVVVVFLLPKVRRGDPRELVGTAGERCVSQDWSARTWRAIRCLHWHTEGGYDAAATGEDAPGADVLLSHAVLDGSHEETRSAGNEGALDAGGNRILGVVVVIFAVRRHFGWLRWSETRRAETRMSCGCCGRVKCFLLGAEPATMVPAVEVICLF